MNGDISVRVCICVLDNFQYVTSFGTAKGNDIEAFGSFHTISRIVDAPFSKFGASFIGRVFDVTCVLLDDSATVSKATWMGVVGCWVCVWWGCWGVGGGGGWGGWGWRRGQQPKVRFYWTGQRSPQDGHLYPGPSMCCPGAASSLHLMLQQMVPLNYMWGTGVSLSTSLIHISLYHRKHRQHLIISPVPERSR